MASLSSLESNSKEQDDMGRCLLVEAEGGTSNVIPAQQQGAGNNQTMTFE